MQDAAARELRSGTYVRVIVPPPMQRAGGTLQAIDLVERRHRQDLPPGVHPYQRPLQVPQEDGPLPGYDSGQERQNSFGTRSPHGYYQTVTDVSTPGDRPSSLPPLAGSPSHWLLPVGMNLLENLRTDTIPEDASHWLLPVGMNLLENLRTDTIPEDATVEWVTWYLGMPFHPRCEEMRTLNVDVEQHLWYRDLCELWNDYLLPYVPAKVLVVDPNPPRAPYQSHVGHLILVQGEFPGHVPTLITAIFESQIGRRLMRLACYVPQFPSNRDIIGLLGLERICHGQQRDCFASVAGFDILDEGLAEVQDGNHIILTVPRRPPAAVSLLQHGFQVISSFDQKLDSRPRRCHYEDDPAEHRQQYLREYQDQEPINAAVLPLMLGFEQQLLQLWPQFVQPGPGGVEMRIQVRTWFNDHERHPICDAFRDASLFEDVTTWRATLLQTWRDFIDLAMPVDFHLVAPTPTSEVDPVAAHIILLQRPLADARSTLISVFDDAVWHGHPRRSHFCL
eukprot:s1134_g5.t1